MPNIRDAICREIERQLKAAVRPFERRPCGVYLVHGLINIYELADAIETELSPPADDEAFALLADEADI